jgi:hypothetical protein
VEAIQVNFADHRLTPPPDWDANEAASLHGRVIFGGLGGIGFLLEGSTDGVSWITLKDTRNTPEDNPHDLVCLDEATDLRYVRISHILRDVGSAAAISGLRVFGSGYGQPPDAVGKIEAAVSLSGMDAALSWPRVSNADGYSVRYGLAPDKLYNSWQLFGKNELNLSFLNKGAEYYAAIDSFNENGVTPGTVYKIS